MAFWSVRQYYALECTVEAESYDEAVEKGNEALDEIQVECSSGATINFVDCIDTEAYKEGT